MSPIGIWFRSTDLYFTQFAYIVFNYKWKIRMRRGHSPLEQISTNPTPTSEKPRINFAQTDFLICYLVEDSYPKIAYVLRSN